MKLNPPNGLGAAFVIGELFKACAPNENTCFGASFAGSEGGPLDLVIPKLKAVLGTSAATGALGAPDGKGAFGTSADLSADGVVEAPKEKACLCVSVDVSELVGVDDCAPNTSAGLVASGAFVVLKEKVGLLAAAASAALGAAKENCAGFELSATLLDSPELPGTPFGAPD